MGSNQRELWKIADQHLAEAMELALEARLAHDEFLELLSNPRAHVRVPITDTVTLLAVAHGLIGVAASLDRIADAMDKAD